MEMTEVKINKRRYERPLKYRETSRGLHVLGIDFGYRGIHCVERIGKYEIWKQPGCASWSGVGMTSYGSTTYYLVEILDRSQEGRAGVIKFLYDGKFGLRWRAGIRALQDMASNMRRQ